MVAVPCLNGLNSRETNMAKSKSKRTSAGSNVPALRIGSRVRGREDGVEGRIVWANAVAVKIAWADGEQVTWKRDTLASRPIEILDGKGNDDQSAPPTIPATSEMAPTADAPRTEPSAAPTIPEPNLDEALPRAVAQTTDEQAAPVPASAEQEHGPETADPPASVPIKPKRQRKAAAGPKAKKVGALDAAARVLAEAGVAMTCPEMIAAMASKGYWTSPGGKTPAATLSSAILREMKTQGEQARFRKVECGRFARTEVP
jgi:hypothetical protein